eukprot:gb/GEZN01012012.1/.p1 GENE.gb/GEZN01012012.1/~~gb/GEZN01012012.1/.p1  ORF type:complete len:195 (-),score=12.64 gb/GEZN01012012.1/:36-620(-)
MGALTSAHDMRIFFWIDWCCTDQDNTGPDMATLPAFVATSTAVVASWTDEYASRAWCRVELLMAYSFIFSGKTILTVPENYVSNRPRGSGPLVRGELTVPDPLEGKLTNLTDMDVIKSLRGVAERSDVFSTGRMCWNNTTNNCFYCLVANVSCLCQCCGFLAWVDSRNVVPGQSRMKTVGPPMSGSPGVQVMKH